MAHLQRRGGLVSRLSAAIAVGLAIENYREEVAAETLRLFRMHLQVTVRQASPLAVDLASHDGVDLIERLGRLRPAPNWLARPAFSDIPGASTLPLKHSRTGMASHYLRSSYAASLALADYERAEGPLAFDVASGAVQVVGRVGTCTIHTHRQTARLSLPEGIPETVIEAMRGRRIDAIVDHPALAGRNYVVRDIVPGFVGHGYALVFSTGLVRFEMPWRDLLEERLAKPRRRGSNPARSRAAVGSADRT